MEGTHDTAVIPTINTWYRFIVELESVGNGTAIRVKVWQDNTSEPTTWQINITDTSSPLTSGTFGLWAYNNGSKYWDELAVASLTAVSENTPTPTNTAVSGNTATPTSTPAATSTPTTTPDPSQPAVIQRSTYSIAGQAVALRVVEKDADSPSATILSNRLYYYHTDHLGSNSAMSDTSGVLVAGSTSRFAPFGTYRTEPTADLTDRGFTGHMENRSVGLTYMNARFYLSGVGRFVTADSIVPNPANPQSFNRFSYVENRPLNLVDPTGHRTCSSSQAATGDESCDQNIAVTQEGWELFADDMQSMLDSKFGTDDSRIIFSPEGSYIPSNLAEMKAMQSAGRRAVNAMLDHVDASNCGCNNLIMGVFGFDVGTDENGFPIPRTVDQKFYETNFDYDAVLSENTDIVIFAQRFPNPQTLSEEWLPGHAALMVVPDYTDPENSIILQTNSPATSNGIYFTVIRNNTFYRGNENIIYMKQKWIVGPLKI